jgi:cell wall-associated NlpC family hydrolase
MQGPSTITLYEDIVPPKFAKPANFRRKANILTVAICTVVLPGVFATMAVPAYGAAPQPTAAQHSTAVLAHNVHIEAQTYQASEGVTAVAAIQRDSFGATSPATLARRKALAAQRHTMLASVAGPSLAGLLANPPQPHFSLSKVVEVAEKYRGVPYVFGGESPSGFDCSGLTAYVYAQFGISLPHSAAAQGQMGTKIARSAAKPGDLVVMDGGSHVGIFLGGGRMIDAPEPGRVVSNDAIYDNDYFFVRFGI